MVNGATSAALAALLVLPCLGAFAADRYEDDWSYRIRPWKREPVAEVKVDAAGLGDAARDPASEPEPCTTFRPGEDQIRSFFARAKRVSARGFLHETDWSACYASGTLLLRSGGAASWMVQRFGAGYLKIDGAPYYFDCSSCQLGVPVGAAKP
jgi:hypothetical protein